jgi:tetratricopeptide (TPR) repeat protein
MSEEMRDQHYAEQLVHKYEEMIARNESYYFDVDQFEEIIDFYCESNKYAFAIKVIEYAYTLFPENTTLALREVQILAEMGFLTKALSKLKTLRKFEPQNEEVLLTMASIYSQLREHKMAIELYKKALEFAGDELFEEINMEIALEYENMDRYDKAIEVLHVALERQPENETLLYELAYCYEMSDRTAECIEYYRRFLDTFPYSFPAWYNMGNAYQKLDQLSDAVEAYDYCLAIQEDFVPAIMNKAHALFKMEKYHESIKVFEESYTYETPQANTYCHIGECFEKLGELDKALFYYKKSMHCDEFFGDAYIGMGIVLDLMGRTKEGILFMEKAIAMEPENVDYKLFMAELLNKLGEFERSGDIYRVVAEKFEDNEDVWLDYADWAMQQKNSTLALQLTNDGWSHNPQSDTLGFRKVAYLLDTGNTAEAEELLLRLMTKNPEGARELAEYYPAIEQNQLFIDLSRGINP